MASEATMIRVLDLLTRAPRSQIESLSAGGAGQAKSLRRIVATKNVVAVGISEKISKKRPTGKLAVTFYVEKKIPPKKLRGDVMIPPTGPESWSGPTAVPTDVIAIGRLRLEVNAIRNPVQPGNSIGHVDITAGTLGALVIFFSSRRRHTRSDRDWSSDVCSSDLHLPQSRARRRGSRASGRRLPSRRRCRWRGLATRPRAGAWDRKSTAGVEGSARESNPPPSLRARLKN